ncbi:hypothetical protein [Cesiribacter sp. SM1]|uniref:hypothetical protein n=1 Tax=Cesiribacter sp. SM1 TaxID=2861196 RepID=UPI001CD62725|nr:hypothetical protein [Cesiribacter sp. SM1]
MGTTKKGLWIITGAITAGRLIGVLAEITDARIMILIFFIAGSTVMYVLKEKLPQARKNNFRAFAVELSLYTALLL